MCTRCRSGFADFFFFSSRRRHTRCSRDWSSDVCSSDLSQLQWFNPAALCIIPSSPGQTVPKGALAPMCTDVLPGSFPVFGDLGLSVLRDRKSTRLNSSHGYISYAVFCLKKKKNMSNQLTYTC